MNNGIYSIIIWVLVLAVSILAAGCATYEWRKMQNGTEEDWDGDVADCKFQVDLNYQNYSLGRNAGSAFAAGLGDAIRRNNLMGSCMETKGWRKTRVK